MAEAGVGDEFGVSGPRPVVVGWGIAWWGLGLR